MIVHRHTTARRDYFAALQVYKSLNGMSPVYMQDMFSYTRDINSRLTRSAATDNLSVPRIHKQVYSQSIQFNGARIWNSLPENIRCAPNLNVFKMLLKKWVV